MTEVAGLDEAPALGGTPAGRAANGALRAFSKAARAFTLYDPQNEAVRRFLQEYRDALAAFLQQHGTLDLEVRQFELARNGEIVHAEKDREKSLAYRLYRDGLRRLTIERTATWEEELKLLEILSVRFIGVRQQEEDVVTLLTRAAFRSIRFNASAGLVATEEDPAPPAKKQVSHDFPADFDGPTPPLMPPRQFGCFPIPQSALDQFEAEESSEKLPGNAVRMVRELLDDADAEEMKTLVPAVEEVRDFLLAELDIKHLRDLAKVVMGQHGIRADILGPALKPLATPLALQKILGTIKPGDEPSEALIELLEWLERYGVDLFDALVDRLAAAPSDAGLRALAFKAARGRKEKVLARLGDPALREPLLAMLEQIEPGSSQAAAQDSLLEAVQSPDPEVRLSAARSLAKLHVVKAFDVIKQVTIDRESVGMDAQEAEVMGAALAELNAPLAGEAFAAWLKPPQASGLLGRIVAKKPRRMLVWAAVAGYVHIPGEQTLATLREIAAGADDELKKHCLKSIALWRRRQNG